MFKKLCRQSPPSLTTLWLCILAAPCAFLALHVLQTNVRFQLHGPMYGHLWYLGTIPIALAWQPLIIETVIIEGDRLFMPAGGAKLPRAHDSRAGHHAQCLWHGSSRVDTVPAGGCTL